MVRINHVRVASKMAHIQNTTKFCKHVLDNVKMVIMKILVYVYNAIKHAIHV